MPMKIIHILFALALLLWLWMLLPSLWKNQIKDSVYQNIQGDGPS